MSNNFVGCLQAVEAIKVLQSYDIRVNVAEAAKKHYQQKSSAEIGESTEKRRDISPLIGKQILYDAAAGEFHNFVLPPRNSLCAVCGDAPKIHSMDDSKENLRQYAEQASQVV